jgi:hypothetical protein
MTSLLVEQINSLAHSQLIRDGPHSGFEGVVRFFRLLLQPRTTDHTGPSPVNGRFLFCDGVKEDVKYGHYPVGIFLATSSFADQVS